MKCQKLLNYIIPCCMIFPFFLVSCSNENSNPKDNLIKPTTCTVRWDGNRESAVNRKGGGYEVCYSKSKSFDPKSVNCKEIVYKSGRKTPTSTKIGLMPGTWYVKVSAFSSLDGYNKSSSSEIQSITIE